MRQIIPIDNNGSIQLKFSVAGKRYSLSPGGNYSNKRDLALAQALATRIYNDVLAGVFDPSLDKYRSGKVSQASSEKRNPPGSFSLLEIWDKWVTTLQLSEATKADHYEMIRRMIVKSDARSEDTAWLTEAKLAPATFNKRLSYMRHCFRWAQKEKLVGINPYEDLKSRKAVKVPVKPFTLEEINRILNLFSRKYPHYRTFIEFLFLSGVRTSEAIGLRWRDIDFDRNEILIAESLPKDRTGNGYKRIRKGTKTGSIRYLTMTVSLRHLLKAVNRRGDEDLVFLSAKGCTIDSGNFREDWKKVLEELKIPYRKPYSTRHTLLSHAIEQGIPITGVAYLAGHSDTRMVMQTYGHLIDRPQLPELRIH